MPLLIPEVATKDEALEESTEIIMHDGNPKKWLSYEREVTSWLKSKHRNLGLQIWDDSTPEISASTRAALRQVILAKSISMLLQRGYVCF